MMKRFLSMIAILAISLVAACADLPASHPSCKGCPSDTECCGACPCGQMGDKMGGEAVAPAEKGMMKGKHHKKHHGMKHSATKAPAAAKAPTAPAAAASPTIPVPAKEVNVIEGVKKIIKDIKKPE